LLGPHEIVFVFSKSQVARFSLIGGSKSLEDDAGVADDRSTNVFSNFCRGKTHGIMLVRRSKYGCAIESAQVFDL
jgi:hypothetical protein